MYRTIDCRLWDDPKVRQLEAKSKLLFLYLITNRHTHLSGLYYLSLATMSHDMCLPEKVIEAGMDELQASGLVLYDREGNVVWVVNMLRYQSTGSKADISVKHQLSDLHKSPLIQAFIEYYPSFAGTELHPKPNRYRIGTLSILYRQQKQEQEQNKEQEQNIAQSDSDESSSPADPVVIRIPLANRTEFDLLESQSREFISLFPGVDVAIELNKMRAWCIANPTRCKTRRGVMAFITRWLSKAQDNCGKTRSGPSDIDMSAHSGIILETETTHGKPRS